MTSNRWQWDNENIYGETQEHIAPYAPLGAMRNNDDYNDRNIYVFLLAFIVYVYPYQHTRLFFFFIHTCDIYVCVIKAGFRWERSEKYLLSFSKLSRILIRVGFFEGVSSLKRSCF